LHFNKGIDVWPRGKTNYQGLAGAPFLFAPVPGVRSSSIRSLSSGGVTTTEITDDDDDPFGAADVRGTVKI
jgi:hypothetical protein